MFRQISYPSVRQTEYFLIFCCLERVFVVILLESQAGGFCVSC